jgi:hypothetical protein
MGQSTSRDKLFVAEICSRLCTFWNSKQLRDSDAYEEDTNKSHSEETVSDSNGDEDTVIQPKKNQSTQKDTH